MLVTGEAVALDLRPAALPSRLLAGALDGLIQLAIFFLLALVGVLVPLDVSEAAAGALGVITLVLVLIVYPVTFETLLRGRTPGKAAMGLRVVRDDGGPIGFRHAFIRGLAGAVIERPGATFFLAAIVTMLLNERSKRLGDLLAGTIVLRERVSTPPVAGATMPAPLVGWASSLDLAGVPDTLALSARQFLARQHEMTAQARADLGGRLVGAVVEAVGPPPPGTPGWAVLAAVLAERSRREHLRLSGGQRWQDRGPAAGPGYAQGSPPPYPQGSSPPYAPAGRSASSDVPPHPGNGDAPTSGAGGFALPS